MGALWTMMAVLMGSMGLCGLYSGMDIKYGEKGFYCWSAFSLLITVLSSSRRGVGIQQWYTASNVRSSIDDDTAPAATTAEEGTTCAPHKRALLDRVSPFSAALAHCTPAAAHPESTLAFAPAPLALLFCGGGARGGPSRCGPTCRGERLWCGTVRGSGRLAVGFQGPVLQRVQRQQGRRRPGSPETVRGGDPRTSLPERPQPSPPRGLRAAAVQGAREGAAAQVPGTVRSGPADARGKRRAWTDRAGRKTSGWRRDGGRYSGLPPRRRRERTAERRQGAGQGGGAEARAGQPRREPRSYPGPEHWTPLSVAGLRSLPTLIVGTPGFGTLG